MTMVISSDEAIRRLAAHIRKLEYEYPTGHSSELKEFDPLTATKLLNVIFDVHGSHHILDFYHQLAKALSETVYITHQKPSKKSINRVDSPSISKDTA